MSLPINIPGRIVKDQAVTALWANSVREAIARLASRKVPRRAAGGGGGGSPHPFKIVADTVSAAPVIRVGLGRFTRQTWTVISDVISGASVDDPPTINGGSLGTESTDGYWSVSVSTTYGVWIIATTARASRTPFSDGSGYPETMTIHTPRVIIDSTNTTAADADTLTASGTYQGYCAWFLGTAVVDGDGAVAISNGRKSDISVVEPVWIHQTIVAAGANDITAGSDGGAYYEA